MDNKDEWKCDQCMEEVYELYSGWFFTAQRLNPWAEGTATARLMQYRRVCKECLNKLKELGLKV